MIPQLSQEIETEIKTVTCLNNNFVYPINLWLIIFAAEIAKTMVFHGAVYYL